MTDTERAMKRRFEEKYPNQYLECIDSDDDIQTMALAFAASEVTLALRPRAVPPELAEAEARLRGHKSLITFERDLIIAELDRLRATETRKVAELAKAVATINNMHPKGCRCGWCEKLTATRAKEG